MNAHPEDLVNARNLADLVLIDAKMEDEETPDPIDVCAAFNIPIYEVPSVRLGRSRGLMVWSDGGYVIEIDEGLPEAQKQAVAAHELGHVACKIWGLLPRDWERFAWLFAGALLVRDRPLRETWARCGELRGVIDRWEHVPPTMATLALGERGIAGVHVVQDHGVRYTRSRHEADLDVVKIGVRAWLNGRASNGPVQAMRLNDARRRAAVLLAA